jgi:hypothetical protein
MPQGEDQFDGTKAEAEAVIRPDGVLDGWKISAGKRKPR